MGISTTCKATTKKGLPCPNWAIQGSDFCFTHSPERAKDRAKARRRGGKARHGRTIGTTGERAKPVTFSNPADVLTYLEGVANNLARLENSVSRAQAQVRVAQAAISTWQTTDQEERIESLERLIREMEER